MPFIKGASETTSLILQLYKATSIERSHGWLYAYTALIKTRTTRLILEN